MSRYIREFALVAFFALTSSLAQADTCGPAATYLDRFNTVGYSGNQGSLDWNGNWVEIGDDNLVDDGNVRVTSDSLRIEADENNTVGVWRTADLSGYASSATATLSLDYRRSGLQSSSEYVAIEASSDGGNTWTELAKFQGPGSDATFQAVSYDITAYMGANTRIRLISPSAEGDDRRVYFDNIQIEVTDSSQCSPPPPPCNAQTTYLDAFDTISYSGNQGSQNWSGDWVEIGESDGAGSGNVEVKTDNQPYSLRIEVEQSGAIGIWRAADLSGYSASATATLNLDDRRSGLQFSSEYVAIEVSSDGGSTWTELAKAQGPGSDTTYQALSYDITPYMSANTRIRLISSTFFSAEYKVYFDNIQITVDDSSACASANADHFTISHDGQGIRCLTELVGIQASLSDGQADTAYAGQVTLDAGSANGYWVLVSGNGQFNDSTSGDGRAQYQFATSDVGIASFGLYYPSGPTAINISATDGTIADDDSEGLLQFTPSGLLITAQPVSNPPPGSIDATIPSQTAAQAFSLYLTAYGQTPSDPVCGVIESYDGNKNLHLWSPYINPLGGTLPVMINGSPVADNETAATTQGISFSQGQAGLNIAYADVGAIQVTAKDSATSNPDLPTGIIGTSQDIIVKPAGFTLSNIHRTSDGRTNPAALDVSGTAFMAAGDAFTLQVTAINALGAATPNFGLESLPEGVFLTPNLISAGGTDNPSINYTIGFNGGFSAGAATGSDFSWPEVGIITLTPSIGDGDYLGGGDVTGATSERIGRFTPYDFAVQLVNTPSLQTQCGSFNYIGQAIPYAVSPNVAITARALGGQTTNNYSGPWWRLADIQPSYSHNGPISNGAGLDASAATHTAISCSACNGIVTSNFNGNLTYTRGSPETDPFSAAIDIQFNVIDGDGIAYLGNPFLISAIGFDNGAEQRSGQAYAQDTHGTYANIGDLMTIHAGSRYYDSGAGGWIDNLADNCGSYSFAKTDNGIGAIVSPASPVALSTGSGDLQLQISTDPAPTGGSSRIDFSWPTWLNGPASATATFGIFRGDDRRLYWKESH